MVRKVQLGTEGAGDMNIVYVLVPLAILLGLGALGACIWAIRSGQFDDVETPAHRILLSDETNNKSKVEQKRPASRRGV